MNAETTVTVENSDRFEHPVAWSRAEAPSVSAANVVHLLSPAFTCVASMSLGAGNDLGSNARRLVELLLATLLRSGSP